MASPKPHPRRAVVAARVPRDYPDRLAEVAAASGVTRSTWIADALTAALNQQEGRPMAAAHPDPRTAEVPDRAAHDAVKRSASTRPGRSDRAVPKADPTRVRVG